MREPPTVQRTADHLIGIAKSGLDEHARQIAAHAVLTHTHPVEAGQIVARIGEYLAYADRYAEASPGLALELFAEVISAIDTQSQAAAYTRLLHERAGVWYGEAVTLALSSALRNRMAVA
jgi:hypothetical protein